MVSPKHIDLVPGPVIFAAHAMQDRILHENYTNPPTKDWDSHNRIRPETGRLAAAIVRYAPAGLPPAFPLLQVADPLFAAMQIGLAARERMRGKVICVTGSSGKSSTVAMMGQVLWGMVLLAFAIPSLGAAWGASGVFTFVAALSVPFAWAAWLFERGETLSTPQQAAGGRVDKRGALLSLVALFALYGGVGVVWTFLEKIGADAGLSGSSISIVLALANLVSLAACVLMPKLGVGGGLRRWTLLNLAGCVLAAASLALPPSPLSFALGSVVFIVCWTGGALLIFATMSCRSWAVNFTGAAATGVPGSVCIAPAGTDVASNNTGMSCPNERHVMGDLLCLRPAERPPAITVGSGAEPARSGSDHHINLCRF